MAGLEPLNALIYHEQQQEGSMLCAQHALNSLLQGHYFTAPDLSEIARQLDELEGSYNQDQSTSSNNMDDTGFFSIQVLEHALRVWGLSLVRWRGEEMRPYQDRPHIQLAFILNHEQHWYTLRRFGPAWADFRDDPGFGHWYNLNSFLPKPEWVGKLYLGMVLHQAESEGYSVFVVVQTDLSASLALPRTEADHLAGALPEPGSSNDTTMSNSNPRSDIDGVEDEDWELQAALQASLDNDRPTPSPPNQNLTSPDISITAREPGPGTTDIDELDFGATSRRMLQRMRAEQEHAQRELWNSVPRREDDDDEILRRVLAESEATANSETAERDGGELVDEPGNRTNLLSTNYDRNYDDEDAELQAALKASLEQMTEPWSVPSQSTIPVPETSIPNAAKVQDPSKDEGASSSAQSEDNEDIDMDSSDTNDATKAVDLDEMRRRRLAKFGG